MAAVPRKIDVYDEVKPPRCTSCGRLIEPHSRAVHFKCPNCGTYEIWRCERCRIQATQYKCPNCGFIGP